MRIYLAADYALKDEIRKKAIELRNHGHEVSSRWHDRNANETTSFGIGGENTDVRVAADAALCNMLDIRRCDVFVLFTTGEKSRGGRHWETGYATGQNKKIVIIGDIEHAFQCHSFVERYEAWWQFLLWNTNEG